MEETTTQAATITAAEAAEMQKTIQQQQKRIEFLENIQKQHEATQRLINYDYREEETRDIVEYITSNYSRAEFEEKIETEEDREKFKEELNDILWTHDSITGNGSGSYWFSTYKAALSTALNMDLFVEACQELGELEPDKVNAESIDVSIRCYLLGECINAAIDDVKQSNFDF